jgi:hypothetical protein
MESKPNPAATMAIFSLLGLISALLSLFLPALLAAPASPIFIGSTPEVFAGDVFGVMLSIYFLAFAGIRSLAKAFGLVVTSSCAYVVSIVLGMSLGMQASQALGLHWKNDGSTYEAAALAPFFVAGVVGAFLITVAMLRLYSAQSSWPRVLGRSLRWCWFGGILALMGWASGPSIGRSVWSVLQFLPWTKSDVYSRTAGDLSDDSVQVIWQLGMGIVFGLLISRTKLATTASNRDAAPARKLNLANALLFGIMVLGLGLFFSPRIAGQLHQMRR